MTYKLFLDDLRNPSDIWIGENANDFLIARNCLEAMTLIRTKGCPNLISFDNDLGEGQPEGYDFAKMLVELDMDRVISIPEEFKFFVHSANCLAWENIESYLTNYLKQRH